MGHETHTRINDKNLELYNSVREVPAEAKRPIAAGRLKGKTDINPMWRIKALTEQFGPCGTGWKPEITRQWLEPSVDGQVAAFCNINLYIKDIVTGKWSDPIPGTGGNMFIVKESAGMHVNDECFKSAYTDAISVACKALGFGADVYWQEDSTKYTNPVQGQNAPAQTTQPSAPVDKCSECGANISPSVKKFSMTKYGAPLCMDCQKKRGREND